MLHVAHDCDLALVTVEEEEFWSGVEPLALGGVPVRNVCCSHEERSLLESLEEFAGVSDMRRLPHRGRQYLRNQRSR